jgi:hypothetical protein
MGLFGWVRNNRIVVIFEIKIIVIHSNANLLFRNNENNCYFMAEMKYILFFSTLHYYFKQTIQIIFLSFGITSPFYYPHANREIIIFH